MSCSGLDGDYHYKHLKHCKNIVYNCNKCANSNKDLNAMVSMLSNEIRELKNLFHAYINESNESVCCKNKKETPAKRSKTSKTSNIDFKKRSRSPLPSSSLPSPFSSTSVDRDVLDDANRNLVAVTTELKEHHLNVTDDCNTKVLRSRRITTRRRASIGFDDNTYVIAKTKSESDIPVSNSGIRARRVSTCLSGIVNYAVSSQVEDGTSVNNSGWINVNRRKRKKQIIVGNNSNKDLEVINSKKWVHLSSFKSNVTVEQVLDYIAKKACIGKINLECYKLVKMNADLNALSKISFKVGISAGLYKELFKSSLWPAGVIVRPFKFK